MPYPSTVPIKALEAKHTEVAKYETLMGYLTLLFKGGWELKQNGSIFLRRHSKELGTSYQSRLNALDYSNILSTIISYYSSRLLEYGIQFDFRVDGDKKKLAQSDTEFYDNLLSNVDNANTSTEQFFERAAVEVLLYSSSYFLVDLPKLPVVPSSLGEQLSLGGLSPYLVYVAPSSIINWEFDAEGNYNWVLIHTVNTQQSFLQPSQTIETYRYFNKTEFATYHSQYVTGKQRSTDAILVDSGFHALADKKRVPLHCVSGDTKLWLGNRTYLALIAHLNLTNSLENSLFLSANPIPTFTNGPDGTLDLNQTVSEYAAIQLPAGASFSWSEPQGKSFDALMKSIDSLREDIYRSSHLVSQGRSSKASATASSGIAKELDMQPAASVLNAFSTLIKKAIQSAFEDCSEIRSDNVEIDVRMQSYSDDATSATLGTVLETKSLNIPSDTLNKELNKKVARVILKDAGETLLNKICNEIDSAKAIAEVTPTQDRVTLTERGTL